MDTWVVMWIVIVALVGGIAAYAIRIRKLQKTKAYERGLKMVPMLIHLPPASDDIVANGRDERDVMVEAMSQAQVMYSIIASTVTKGRKARIFGQKHISFEIVAKDGQIKYFAVVPAVLTEVVKQAINAAYPAARLEETERENIFSREGKVAGVAGGELVLKKEYVYPIATYEDTKRDASMAILNALSGAKEGEGVAVQILCRPTDGGWTKIATDCAKDLREGKKTTRLGSNALENVANLVKDVAVAPFKVPDEHDKDKNESLSNLQQEEIAAIEGKTRYPGFETLIRVVASTTNRARSEALVGGVVSAFSQFDSQTLNAFRWDAAKDMKKLSTEYIFRFFPLKNRANILNSLELASIFHLPEQNAIPNAQVERQAMKQVDGPANLVDKGVLIGVNEFRGQKKEIRLSVEDRRRHLYVIGSTGMGKSKFMRNIAYQDMMAGRGFAFIDPHGDVVEELLSMVPPERMDDVIYFNPGDIENPIGMNMFEYQTEDQKDFIVQEGINMLYSLFDPGHTGIFGPRGEHMFRNAALLLMSDPNGSTFIDIPQCFIDPEFVREKLQYVRDKNVYDYWTKEFPASQKSQDAGEVTTWFVSKWGPFVSNTIIRNTLGQTKSGFNIREIMDGKKILLANLSKGAMGDINSQLLGMIFVMKFQAAAMSRVDTPEDEREDFCLFVDEFQNFSTESFESILSEARKFRLNLVVANQFMTQLTDKIREGILGNVGSIVAGRLGVTDAELMEKVFKPTFTVEDLHKTPNHNAIATVMMHGVPSTPFTMTWPVLGEGNPEVLKNLKLYVAAKYARPRSEVEAEIRERQSIKKVKTVEPEVVTGKEAAAVVNGGATEGEVTEKIAAEGTSRPAVRAKKYLDKTDKTAERSAENAPVSAQEAQEGASDAEDDTLLKLR